MNEKYKQYKVYKITNSVSDKCYIGSTAQSLKDRMYSHRSSARKGLGSNTSSKLFDEDFDGCIIELIENYPCSSKQELLKRERYWIENSNCVNERLPSRSRREYKKDNADKIKKQSREYLERNRDEIQRKRKAHYMKRQHLTNEKHDCICGGKYTNTNRKRHLKTIIHTNYLMNNLNN